jgi:hypothetical protein
MGREAKVKAAVRQVRECAPGERPISQVPALAAIEPGRTRRRILHRATGSGAHAPQLCPDRQQKVPEVRHVGTSHGSSRGPKSMAEEGAAAHRAHLATLPRRD